MNSLRQYIPRISLNRFKYTKVSTENVPEEGESEKNKKDKKNKKTKKEKTKEEEEEEIAEWYRNVFLL